MKLFGLNITRARPGPDYQLSTPQLSTRTFDRAAWLRGEDLDENDGAKLLSPYSQSAWVYIAVSVLAETVGQVPFRIARMPKTLNPNLNPNLNLNHNPSAQAEIKIKRKS